MPLSLFEPGSPTQVLLDAMSAMVFIVDEHLTVHDANVTARERLGTEATAALNRVFGEVVRCTGSGFSLQPLLHSDARPCGTAPHCTRCVVSNSTAHAFAASPVRRRPAVITIHIDGEDADTHVLVSATRFVHNGRPLVMLVLEDVTELAELRRMVPICAWCKKVRDDGEYREDLERYLRRHAIVEVSHGICPDCQAREFPNESM